MRKYLLKRLFVSLLSVLGAVTIVFFIIRLSGNPARLMLPPEATADQVAALNKQLGFDHNIIVQYIQYLGRIFTGDFGNSLYYKESTLKLVIERLPATLEIALLAIVVAMIIGVFIGAVTAIRKNTWLDYSLNSFVFLLQAIPVFFIGILFILLFSVKLDWLPTSGNVGALSLILPVLTLAAYPIVPIARTTRSTLIEMMDENFALLNRAQGFLPYQIVFGRGLKNIGIPVITVVALELNTMIGGAIVTENIFSWPGLGQLVVQAVNNKDFPLVQTTVLVLSVIYILINFLTDIIYLLLDPRVNYQ